MQETSALYNKLISEPGHWFECSLVIGEEGRLITENSEKITFGNMGIMVASSGGDGGYRDNMLISMSTSHSIFSENTPAVGCCISGEIDIEMLKPSGEIPRMSLLVPYVRVTNGSEYSEWIKKGVYYVDTKEITQNGDGLDILTIHGYDALLKGEVTYPSDSAHDYPLLDKTMVAVIADYLGLDVDSRTYSSMTSAYKFGLPLGYSCREMLGYIASAYGGNFVMNDNGELRLVLLSDLPPETRYLIDTYGYTITFGADATTGEEVRILV